jgi:NADPH:quinone reductase-like Zn-dependent oxidoreductase
MTIVSQTNAVRIHAFGGVEKLRLESLPLPALAADEALVEVHAASVNPVDYKIREGKYPAVKRDRLPYVMGRDVSGVVVETGHGGMQPKVGNSVFGMLGIDRGGYSEYVVMKEEEMALKPRSLDAVRAAAVPLAGLTAWQGLFRYGELNAGQRVLIHGGGGGVGHFAIQFAKAKGAHVTTTVSDRHIDFVRSLGADEVIDYKKQRFEEIARDIDLVFDLVAGETQDRSWKVLKEGGTLVSTLAQPSPDLARKYRARGLRYTVEPNRNELTEIARLIDLGKVKPRIARIFDWTEAGEAEDYVEAGHTEGKVVLRIQA